MSLRLRRLTASQVAKIQPRAVSSSGRYATLRIVEDVRENGDAALREHGEHFGDLNPGDPLVLDHANLQAALEEIPREQRQLLERTAERIRAFAEALVCEIDVAAFGEAYLGDFHRSYGYIGSEAGSRATAAL